ncbi:alpha-N-acetylglucosaminidase TIM-barrel domain-containing protein [Micromonospora sp. WMMD1102]|uniref:alpha-N-acetylglucosaminidase n=1 Tax=Micromonospora sp. WMMD1102 TaxID=3016105 RepID=UPI002415889E|nr:alpha-N-acetylglucosaminidase [Micromonospora sp. WMMD1102]MDG4785736.1 alpha-N-acetylglucosaminidase TIM-barrel domain-containing protein [Micromonospora sp. WMMD1102]
MRGLLRELLVRVTGSADRVRVERIPAADDGSAVAGYECRDGELTLRGSAPVAAAAAFGQYLKAYAGRQVSWDSPRLDPPLACWPAAPPTRLGTPFPIRYHLNAVTYGYSTAFWDWDRWEREIDWMALHGVTYPLMQVGHEAVLAELYRRAGLAPARIDEWIGSAAHFPWTWMGNTHSFGGPLPATWIGRHVELAHRILSRMRALGMTPVLPTFGGHVPPELADPSAGELEWQGWRTPILGPESPRFARLAAEFLGIQRELFGTDHHYAVDPFVESVPPSGEPGYLASMGRAVYRTMAERDPEAVWVLAGWPFHYQREFWTPDRVRAFLSDIPAERLLLLDLWGEYAPMWRRDGMYGRRWIWCAIHNFGGRFALFGDLHGLARDVDELRQRRPSGLVGIGLAPEAIENNTVFYELATDLAWGVPLVSEWLDAFARQRYATAHDDVVRAWRILADTLYGPGRTRSIPSPVIARPWGVGTPFAAQRLAGEFVPQDAEPQFVPQDAEPQFVPQDAESPPELADGDAEVVRPSANIDAENDPLVLGALPRIAQAARLLLRRAAEVTVRDPLERDVAELVGHVLAQGARVHIRGIVAAFAERDPAAILAHLARLRSDLLDLDELAGTRADSRVGQWIAAARAWGDSPAEADVMERDARSLVSVWGHQSSGLHDYSGRHWSGLVRDYYLPRWELWGSWLAEAARAGREPDVGVLRDRIVAHEESWRDALGGYSAEPDGDTCEVAARILDRLGR